MEFEQSLRLGNDLTAAEVKRLRKKRTEARMEVYKQYGYYDREKQNTLSIGSDGMKQFLLDEGFTPEILRAFLFGRQKSYYKGISQALMYQALVAKPWNTTVLSYDEVEEALEVVFPGASQAHTVSAKIQQKTVDSIVETEIISGKEYTIHQLQKHFVSAEQCAQYIAHISPSVWADADLLPGMTMRTVIDTVVLEGKHVKRPSSHNVSMQSLKTLFAVVWNTPEGEGLHLLEKAIGEMLYTEVLKMTPDPIAFCNTFLGTRHTHVAGHPLKTAGRYMGISEWNESTESTLHVMMDLWRFHPVAARIRQYRESRAYLKQDIEGKRLPAIQLSDIVLRKLLNIQRPYERDPQRLKEKIREVLGIK